MIHLIILLLLFFTEIESATSTRTTTRHSRRTITKSEDTSLWQTYRSYSSISAISWTMTSSMISFNGENCSCFQHPAKLSLSFKFFLGTGRQNRLGLFLDSEISAKITNTGRQVPIFSYFFLFFSAHSYFSYFLAISSYFSYFLAILLTISKYLLEI